MDDFYKQSTCVLILLLSLMRPAQAIEANDVSQLNATQVQSIVSVPADRAQAELALQGLIQGAASRGDKISVAGASHSMGGHTLYPGGIVVNMLPFRQLQYLPETQTLRVGAGALWSEVIPFLRQYQRTVSIMQSNNAFSVGGSLSVNCHGWQANRPPIASSVRSFRLLLADGQIKTCSRSQNAELFRLALGGYGLFGIILDAELETEPEALYQGQSYLLPATDYVAAFDRHVNQQPGAVMAYGRLRVDSDAFLEEAILNVFVTAAPDVTPPKHKTSASLDTLKHSVFRNSVHHAGGKRMRWELESRFGQFIGQALFWRSDLLDQPLDVIQNEEAESSDLLHEYFIPRGQVAAFIQQLQQIIPRHQVNLLNITLRNVLADHDTEMAYARQEVFGFVILFHQHHTPAEEAQMQALTRDLITAALQLQGTYYLPYRLHATREQFQQTYPQAKKVKQRKQVYDPQVLFQNQFYRHYLE